MKELSRPHLGKYLIKNRVANLFIKVVDAVLAFLFFFSKKNPGITRVPQRILLANSAHMGDVLIMTSILPVLKRSLPNTEISLLIGSWALPIVKNLPFLVRVHVVDHWKSNRANISIWHKLYQYYLTRKVALKEIRAAKYDVAIDFYYHFPNFIPLLWQSGIPVRIGYISGGFGSLLTHPKEWKNLDQHVSKYHTDLLQIMLIGNIGSQELHYCLHLDDLNFDEALLIKASIDPSSYIVIHMGTGDSRKEWPLVKWRSLCEALNEKGYNLVFTGNGRREEEHARLVTNGLSNCMNLCGKLRWDSFVSVISKANLVICVDSLAGHIAAATDTKCVAIRSGMTNFHHWRPLSNLSQTLFNPVPCAPCYLSRGCEAMACVRDLMPNEVYFAALDMMNNPSIKSNA